MKNAKPSGPSRRGKPGTRPADRTTVEDHRATLMADAMEQLQRRGAISRGQHDDQIREIAQESAGQSQSSTH